LSEKILLVNPVRGMPRWPTLRKPAEPVELIYLAGALKSASWDVSILDLQLDYGDPDDLYRSIALNHFPVVGVAIPDRLFLWGGLKITRNVKNLNETTRVFTFGLLAAMNAGRLLDIASSIDFVVTGDLEEFAQESVQESAGSTTRFSGLSSIEHRIAKSRRRHIRPGGHASPNMRGTRALDISFADRRMTSCVIKGGGNPAVAASHGCSGECSFCCVSGYYASVWRPRPVEHVRDELRALVDRFNVTEFHLVDSSLLGPTLQARNWASHLCKVLSEFRPRLRLKTSCRLADLDEANIVMLQQAGFRTLKIGMETFCAESQTVYGKNVDREAAIRRLDFIRAGGMEVSIGFIMFDPYLSIGDLRSNLEFLLMYPDCWGRHLLLSELIAYPGTRIEQQLDQDGLALSRSMEGTSWRFRDQEVERVHGRFLDMVTTKILDLEFDHYARCQTAAAERSQAVPFIKATGLADCEDLLKQCWIELFHHALDEGHPLDKFASCRRRARECMQEVFRS
jgi:anaerobic magnesium-protoporphyrin IX monomethyl ester cyclase